MTKANQVAPLLATLRRLIPDATEAIDEFAKLAKYVDEVEARAEQAERSLATVTAERDEARAALRELQAHALPTDCARCGGVGAEPPGCPESGPCECCGGWTAHKRLVAGETADLRARLAKADAVVEATGPGAGTVNAARTRTACPIRHTGQAVLYYHYGWLPRTRLQERPGGGSGYQTSRAERQWFDSTGGENPRNFVPIYISLYSEIGPQSRVAGRKNARPR